MPLIEPWPALASAGVGCALGFLGTGYALQVSAGTGLPGLGRSISAALRKPQLPAAGAGVSGVAAAIFGLQFGWSVTSFVFAICTSMAMTLAVTDLRSHRLPYAIVAILYLVTGVPLIGVAIVTRDIGLILKAVLSAAIAVMAFLILALALPGQLGLGDVVLFGWVAFSLSWFGWRAIEVGVLAGLLGQIIAGLVFRVWRGAGQKLPFGPALLLGWFIGASIAGTYLSKDSL